MFEVTMISCWVTFIAVIGCMWLTGCRLDTANLRHSNRNCNKVVISRETVVVPYIISLIQERKGEERGETAGERYSAVPPCP